MVFYQNLPLTNHIGSKTCPQNLVISKDDLGWEFIGAEASIELTSSPEPSCLWRTLEGQKLCRSSTCQCICQSPGTGELSDFLDPRVDHRLLPSSMSGKDASHYHSWGMQDTERQMLYGLEKNACGIDAGYYKLCS